MQYTLSINQTKALEWGLNAQQALLFSFVYECPSWCKAVTKDDTVFYALSKQKIVDELPLLTDKIDTAYRLLKQLAAKGMIELSHTSSITLVRLTDIGKTWNHDHKGSEKYPSKGRKNIRGKVGKISEQGRKKIREGSENSPTNQDTSNQDTSNHVDDAGASSSAQAVDCIDHERTDATDTHVGTIPASEAEDPFLSNLFSPEPSETLPAVSAPAQSRERFAMHFEWVPSEWFAERCRTSGVNLTRLEPEQQESILGEFRSYWEARGDTATQAQWEHKLLNQLRRVAAGGHAPAATQQQKRAAVSASIMNIDDTDW
jgi:DNA-binding PadR family transcriptional regulator